MGSRLYYKIYNLIGPHFRRKRVQQFKDAIKPAAGSTILDVGGYYFFWKGHGVESKITILNTDLIPLPQPDPQFEVVTGDGTKLQFADGQFDIVHSNSVIEHVGDFERQKAFAREVRRHGCGCAGRQPEGAQGFLATTAA